YETFGIVIIEAFSMRTPVVVNNLGALPEVVEESGGGVIYNNGDGLTQALDTLAGNPQLRGQLALEGYPACLCFWTDDAHMEQYLQLVTRLRQQRRTEQLS